MADALGAADVRGRVTLLSAEEERLITTAWKERRCQKSLTELLQRHRPLLHVLARRIVPWGQSKDDLIQDGMLGLTRAAQIFDPSRGVRFGIFALPYARSEMLRSTRNLRGAVRVPISGDAASVFKNFARAMKTWEAKHGRDLDEEGLAELALRLGITHCTAHRLHSWRNARSVELDAPVQETGGSLLETLADGAATTEDRLAEREAFDVLISAMRKEIAALPERSRQALSASFGGRPTGRAKVAETLGVSQQRVSQLQKMALEELQKRLAPVKAAVEGTSDAGPAETKGSAAQSTL